MRFPDLPGYRYEAFLGEDPFGWAFVASHESGVRRTVRVYKAQATSDRILYPFFKTLSSPTGALPGAVPVHDYALQNAKGLAACATPFYGWKGSEDDGAWQVGSLRQVMGMLSREQTVGVIRDLAAALGALHETDLFHGGLRPSGIYLAPDAKGGHRALISDFGQIFMGGLQYLEAGEPLFYAAPEQLAMGDFNAGRGKRWDVYSFGVVAFELLAGSLPRLGEWRRYAEEHPEWLASSPAITFGEISELTESFLSQLESDREAKWPGEAADRGEAALREAISACLRYAPEDRPATMTEVAAAMQAALAPTRAHETSTTASAPAPVKAGRAKADGGSREKDWGGVPAASGLFEGLSGMEAPPNGKGGDPRRMITEWRANPVVRWQVAAIGSLVATLALTCFVFFNYVDARQERDHVESELRESERKRRAGVDRQKEINRKIREGQIEKNQLISELNETEDSKNHLLGQTKLARQLLRETQENGDRFFRLVLDNRDSDVPEFRSGRAAALEDGRRHYERLVETYGDAPDFIASTADALFYLGRIYKEMGEFEKSLATFGEAERRYSTLLESDNASKTEFVKNIAHSKGALGELAIRSGEYSTARHYFTESSRFWGEARSREPGLAPEAALHIHENSLAIVECELAMDRLEAAIDAAMSVGVRLTEMEKAMPGNHRIVGALAKSFALTGRVLEARRENEMARSAYQQSSDLYAKAVRLDAAVDEYQLGLGNSLARVGLLSNDTTKLEGAAEVLGRVVAANPYESTYLKTLADIYGALSVGQRDGGKPKKAIALEEKAISILRPIVEGSRSVAPDVKYSYSQRLAHLAELLGDSGKFDASRAPLKEAIALLEDIADGGNGVSEYRRTLARTRGLAGFACMKSGDANEAKEHLRLAKTEWQSYMAANPDDAVAAQAVKWTAEQLGKLP